MKHILGPSSRSKITGVDEESVQPNALDLKLGKVFRICPNNFWVSNTEKKHRNSVELKPGKDGYYELTPGHYEVVMENIIHVGEGEAGWVITRSTLNRNGCFLTSGLYDTGYHGAMAAVLHVTVANAYIKQGTRIGQYLSFNAESLSSYDGDYGIGKEHDKKYNT